MKVIPYILVFITFFGLANADYNDFETNPYITDEARNAIRPFLLPKDHPAKKTLDKIFHATRATFDDYSLEKAGFNIKFKQPRSFIRVVSHPKLPGYLIKLVTDEEVREKHHKPAWYWFVNRCKGVQKIHEALQKHKIRFFVAPNKWIYPLPIKPYPKRKSNHVRKIIVLLVDDMKLVSKEENLHSWKKTITKEHLDELYTIMKEVGGRSYRAENIPQTKSKKFAFIDTEYPSSSPKFSDIRHYLSSKRKIYWDQIVETR